MDAWKLLSFCCSVAHRVAHGSQLVLPPPADGRVLLHPDVQFSDPAVTLQAEHGASQTSTLI